MPYFNHSDTICAFWFIREIVWYELIVGVGMALWLYLRNIGYI
jgi:hypothetical protein